MKRPSEYLQEVSCLSSALVILLAIACFALFPASALAQSGAGGIQGTVADSTGAVIPGTSIHVVNNATGVATNAKTNGVGFYQVPDLFTGAYTITFTATGMKTYQTSIELQVAQNAVINPVLTAGAVTQEVIVNGAAGQLITPDSGAITSTLENARISQLPEDGRFIDNLVSITTPGLLGGQNLNGSNAEALEYTIDGVPTMNGQFGAEPTRKTQLPDPDTVQEVRVETSGSGAQYATPGTAIVSTKSGSNKFHGTAFETARNNAIGVARAIQDPVGVPTPKYDRNEFGISVGGPIDIPHFYNGRDKSFFFVAYERFSLVQDTAGTANVPTAAMRMGDFSGLIKANGQLLTIYDPSTTMSSKNCAGNVGTNGKAVANPYCRTPFPGNVIPIGEESPTAAIYYQLLPLPSGQFATADPLVHFNYNFIQKQYQYVPQETFRLDHVFNEANRAYLRFTDINSPINTNPSGFYNLPVTGIPAGAANGYADNPSQSFQAGLGYTHIFSSTFFAETILGQQWLDDTQINGVAPNIDYESILNLPNNFGEVGFPALGSGLIHNLQSSQTANRHISQIIWNGDENLTKIVGRHQLHFGGRYRFERFGVQGNGTADKITFGANPTGLYQPTSGPLQTAVTNTGSADASFFLGSAGSYNVNLEPPYSHFHNMEADAYLQDDFHVSKNVTLNLGLRYEAHPALFTANGLANSFDLKNDAQVLAVTPAQLIAEGYTTQAIITNDQNIRVKFETAQQAGFPAKLVYDYNLNFLPRLGFAWQPFGHNTVIRGAYGVYEYPTPLGLYATPTATNNPFTAAYTRSYSDAAQAVDNLPNETIRYNAPQMFGVMGKNTATVVNTNSVTSILPGIALVSTSPNYAPENVTEVNATIEQQFKGNSTLRVSWVFTHGANLPIIDQYNQSPSNYQYEMAFGIIPPTGSVIGTNTYATTATGPYDQTTWGNSSFRTKAGWSNDNALQINFQRLFHRGSAYQIIAEYSKAMAAIGNVAPQADYPGVQGSAGILSSPYGPVVSPGFAPPPRPAGLPDWADYKDMEYYQNYQLDSSTPVLHFKGNGLLDLPIGRGKKFLGHVNRFWNEIVGGYQIAGTFNVASQMFQPPSANWGPTNPITLYKHKVATTDCRSGVCEPSYLWYNGYLPPTVLTPSEAPGVGTCMTNCVTGIPSTYRPYETPIDTTPPPGNLAKNCTGASCYYDTDTVVVTLKDGTQNTILYDGGGAGSNRFSKVFINGPINWVADASLFKVFPITQTVRLRVNFDAFNVFNSPGENNPDANGLQHFNTNSNPARLLQLTARLTF